LPHKASSANAGDRAARQEEAVGKINASSSYAGEQKAQLILSGQSLLFQTGPLRHRKRENNFTSGKPMKGI